MAPRVLAVGATFVLAGLCAAAPVRSQSACDKPRDDFDGLYCLSRIYQQADTDLNDSYSKLVGKLTDPERDVLRSGQLAWLARRNSQCSRREEGHFYVNVACATKSTISRNRFLEDRYRECVSTGCLDSRLGGSD